MNEREKELANKILALCAAEKLTFAGAKLTLDLARTRLGEEQQKAAEKAGFLVFGPEFRAL